MSDPVPITEDTQINERNACHEQTVSAGALGCASVGVDTGSRKVDRQVNSSSA